MSMWRCPHCGTPQAETARCWVCHRSSTTCSTCQHFRRSVAAQVGYCGLDRRRLPLMGTEHRGCWEGSAPKQAETRSVARQPRLEPRDNESARDFVPVELVRDTTARPTRSAVEVRALTSGAVREEPFEPGPDPALIDPWTTRVTLFQDLDR